MLGRDPIEAMAGGLWQGADRMMAGPGRVGLRGRSDALLRADGGGGTCIAGFGELAIIAGETAVTRFVRTSCDGGSSDVPESY